jgi:hypothetical protein
VHAPEGECMAKGKVHKRYEFGCKVSVVTTSKKNGVVGIDAHHSNPYDGKTLMPGSICESCSGLSYCALFTPRVSNSLSLCRGTRTSRRPPENLFFRDD